MAMIALLGSPQGEGTVSETTWEMVAVQVLEETPETAARTLLDWAGSGQTIPEEDVVLALLEEMEAEPAASAVAFAAVLDRADSLRKAGEAPELEKRPTGRRSVPVPLFHQASGDGDHALAGGALCLACGFGCV
ncbi:MAG: hypothetical protein ACLUIW_08825 [Dysosmobacter welbionis]